MASNNLNSLSSHYLKSGKLGILIIHGFSSSPKQLCTLAHKFHQAGYTVSVPRLAGHATRVEDLEKTNAQDWYKSVESAFLELKKDVNKVVVIGASFGGNLAFHLNHYHSKDIQGLISLMTPIDFYHERSLYLFTRIVSRFIHSIRKKGQSGQPCSENPQINQVGSYIYLPLKSLIEFYEFIRINKKTDLKLVKQPILIIQTLNDDVIKPGSARTIYHLINSPKKKIIWLDSKAHTVIWPERHELFDKVYQEMKTFIDECFNDTNNW